MKEFRKMMLAGLVFAALQFQVAAEEAVQSSIPGETA